MLPNEWAVLGLEPVTPACRARARAPICDVSPLSEVFGESDTRMGGFQRSVTVLMSKLASCGTSSSSPRTLPCLRLDPRRYPRTLSSHRSSTER
jgi:hypothetical protein